MNRANAFGNVQLSLSYFLLVLRNTVKKHSAFETNLNEIMKCFHISIRGKQLISSKNKELLAILTGNKVVEGDNLNIFDNKSQEIHALTLVSNYTSQ